MLKFNYSNKYFLIIFISWLFLWLSLGVLPNNLNDNIKTYLDLINYLRVYIPLFFSFFLLLIIFIKYKNFFNYYEQKNSLILSLFIIYFLCQIIGLYQNKSLEFNIENLYLAILGICSLEILIINQFLNTNKNLQYLFYSALILCLFSSLFFFFSNIINNAYYQFQDIFNIRMRGYYDINLDKNFFLQNVTPRSTGISRSFGLINILIIIYLIFSCKKNKFLITLISGIFTFLIWSLESRGSFFIFFFSVIIIITLSKKLNLKKKLFISIYLLLLPLILYETIMFLGKEKLNTQSNNTHQILENNIKTLENNIKTLENSNKVVNKIRLLKDFSSSGRFEIWNSALTSYEKKKIFGYGPQGDRFILSKSAVSKQFYNNSSNAFIYSLLSGGYFGFLAILFIYLNISFKIYILLKKNNIFNNSKDITLKVSVSYIIFFLARSLIENSFSVFSVDFMIFILSAMYVENNLKKISSYKSKV